MDFLEEWTLNKSPKTREEYEKTFRIASKVEEHLEKDIFEFNTIEFTELLKNFECTTVKSLKEYLNVFKLYCGWCNQNGYLKEDKIVANQFTKDDLEKYLNKSRSVEKFISYNELIKLMDRVENAQDAVIFALLYEGIKGVNNSEITNLKVTDYTKDGIVTIGGNNPRKIQVHDKTLELMEDARYQLFYKKLRKPTASQDMKSIQYELPTWSPYLIRQNPKKARSIGGEAYELYTTGSPANWQTINSRVKKIAMSEEINRPYLTSHSILQSGMLYKVLEIEMEVGEGKITIDNFKTVMEQYGGKANNYFILKEMYETVFDSIRADAYKNK